MSSASLRMFFVALIGAWAKSEKSCLVPPVSAFPPHQESEQILLALRSSTKTDVFSEEVTEHLAEYQAWSAQHQVALQKVERSKTLLEQMVAGKIATDTPCTSALLDVKRGVSSVVHDLNSLSEQVGTHVQTLEAETGNLNSTVASFETINQEFSQGMSQCNFKRKEAAHEHSMYHAQLEILKQIIQPSSRYTHTGKVEWPPVAPSLFQDGAWSRDNCLAFIGFTQQHREHVLQGESLNDCDANIDDLHNVCLNVYTSVVALTKEAKKQSENKTCEQQMKKKKNEQMLPLVSQRRQQVSTIKFSSEKLGALEPVLTHLHDRVNKLDAHVVESVQPKCDIDDVAIVPETLTLVHALINSVRECPIHNDVIEQLPEEEDVPHHVSYTVCAGDADCGAEEPIYHNASSLITNPSHVQAIMSWGGELE